MQKIGSHLDKGVELFRDTCYDVTFCNCRPIEPEEKLANIDGCAIQ